MASTIWSIAAPGDRETLASAGIGWLLDPEGSHGLGPVVLDFFCNRAGILPLGGKPVEIKVEEKLHKKRFDISVHSNSARLLIVEVKSKTHGYRDQLLRYKRDTDAVVLRCGFAEWNWPEVGFTPAERESTFPLVTLGEIGHFVIESLDRRAEVRQSTAREFAEHLILEHDFLNGLFEYFIAGTKDRMPSLPTVYRKSDSFVNRLYWQWVQEKGIMVNPKLFHRSEIESKQSGEFLVLFLPDVPSGEQSHLSKIKVTLSGPVKYWLHGELSRGAGILGTPRAPAGRLQLRIGVDTGAQREANYQEFASRRDQLSKDGWRVPGKRPRQTGYYSVLTRDMKLQDFQFGRFVELLESLIDPADLQA